MKNTLYYTSPADCFELGFPVGNGKNGAMMLGGTDAETITLNTDTLWSGYRHGNGIDNAYDRFTRRIRDCIINKRDYYTAEDLCDRLQGPYSESYLCAGELKLSFSDGTVSGYKRTLDLRDGIAKAEYLKDGKRFSETVFASYPDDIIAVKIESEAKFSFSGSLDSMIRHDISCYGNKMTLSAIAPRHVEPEYLESQYGLPEPIVYDEEWEGKKGLRLNISLTAVTDGTTSFDSDGFAVENCTNTVIYIWLGTDFDSSMKYGMNRSIDLTKSASERLRSAVDTGYGKLLSRHISDMNGMFDRVSLCLEYDEKADEIPTDVRKHNVRDGKTDTGLEKLYFDFGRYLLYSSSRQGTRPANLQGIWCNQLRPFWSGNYTTNSNAQMNYYGALQFGMADCHLPFITMLRELSVTGRETAKSLYNSDGWCVHHNTDIWGCTLPVGNGLQDSKWSLFTTAGLWMSLHIWEHYLFTLDKTFLKENYDILRGASVFALDMLCDLGNGKVGICPSTVPERRFTLPNGDTFPVGAGSTFDYELMTELFDAVTKAADILGIEDDPLHDRIEKAISAFPEYTYMKDGSLSHWVTEPDAESEDYMWIDILFGLYPGKSIANSNDEKLKSSIIPTLKKNSAFQSWGVIWGAGVYARLCDGKNARKLLCESIGRDFFDSLLGLNNHVSTGKAFQIDANLGYIGTVAEMLLHSHGDDIVILPAIPDEWKNGSVSGMKARGNITIGIEWCDGKAAKAEFLSSESKNISVKVGKDGPPMTLRLHGGEKYELVL